MPMSVEYHTFKQQVENWLDYTQNWYDHPEQFRSDENKITIVDNYAHENELWNFDFNGALENTLLQFLEINEEYKSHKNSGNRPNYFDVKFDFLGIKVGMKQDYDGKSYYVEYSDYPKLRNLIKKEFLGE